MAELKYTKHLLGKVEDLFKELDYTIRYAKGNFQSGYCIVEHQNVAVINKFYETEGRINVLIDILDRLDIKEEALSEKGLKTFKQLRKKSKKEEEEEEKESQETEKEKEKDQDQEKKKEEET